jgi:hypothetical protein
MQKRAIGAVLWFAAVWFTYEVIWSMTGVPRAIGPILATAAAAMVAIDPTGWFWSRAARHDRRPAVSTAPANVERAS